MSALTSAPALSGDDAGTASGTPLPSLAGPTSASVIAGIRISAGPAGERSIDLGPVSAASPERRPAAGRDHRREMLRIVIAGEEPADELIVDLPLATLDRDVRSLVSFPAELVVEPSAVALGVSAFCRTTLDHRSYTRAESRLLANAIVVLLDGLVAETLAIRAAAAQGAADDREPAVDRDLDADYEAALRVIAARSSEVGLSPHDVAAAVGASTRTLQRVFSRRGGTIADTIRDTRLDRAAAALVPGAPAVALGGLGTAVGFAGPDQAARAFRRRFGMSMRDYRATRPGATR